MTSTLSPSGRKSAGILGLSHLVLSVDNLEQATQAMRRLGYRVQGTVHQGTNPQAKASFVAGPLSTMFDMCLLVDPRGGPAVELLAEPGAPASLRPTPFRPIWEDASAGGQAQTETDFRTLWDSFDRENSMRRFAGLTLLTHDGRETSRLWEVLGVEASEGASGTMLFSLRGALPSHRLRVTTRPDRLALGPSYLNQRGLVCVSFLCQDAARLQERLGEERFEVSPCFNLSPFGRLFQIFFARGRTGEIYEFLSVPKTN